MERFDIRKERADLQFNERGEVENSWVLETGTFIADYKYRQENPYDFYDGVVKICWYYGIAIHPELNKTGLVVWMNNNGYSGLIQLEPAAIRNLTARKKARQGTSATVQVIGQYTDLLVGHVHRMVWAENHPRILEDWTTFTPDNRTEHDLTVATGYALLANMDPSVEETEEEDDWEEPWEYRNTANAPAYTESDLV